MKGQKGISEKHSVKIGYANKRNIDVERKIIAETLVMYVMIVI